MLAICDYTVLKPMCTGYRHMLRERYHCVTRLVCRGEGGVFIFGFISSSWVCAVVERSRCFSANA